MKNAIGISGMLLFFVAMELLHNGVRIAFAFLAISLVLSMFFLLVYPTLDKIIAETSRDFYFKRHQEYIQKQQEAIKRMEDEILKNRKA